MTGIPAQTLNRYELGQRVPKIDTAVKIAEAIGINPLWLQGYDVPEVLEEHSSGTIVGLRIHERRKELGLTVQDIADEIGVAKSTIQRYENGTIETVKLPVLEAIARILKINPGYLIGKTDEKAPQPTGREVTFDDFTYAMYEQSRELSDENKQKLLEMAEFFKQQQEKEKRKG